MSAAVTDPAPNRSRQCAPAVCMVRPAAFAFNPETAASNRFQSEGTTPAKDAITATREFDAMAMRLREAGVRVCVVPDTAEPVKPDAVFPNNWVSFHADGTVVLYPMLTLNRRTERREAVIEQVARETGFTERRRIDLTYGEREGRYLEGTGSLVLDHAERRAYACRSARTDESLVREWCRRLDYEPVVFDAATADGTPVYHTNVVLWIGESVAGVGRAWIAPADRKRVLPTLAASGRRVLELPAVALERFAGNMLELATTATTGPARVLVLSASAAASLGPATREALAAETGRLLVIDVPTIERLGGGSVRCMLAEVPR